LRYLCLFRFLQVSIDGLVICKPGDEEIARRHGVASVSWEDFLISGPPQG
jgi:hypothetical protein